jgi:hypothetical protein
MFHICLHMPAVVWRLGSSIATNPRPSAFGIAAFQFGRKAQL